MFVKQNKILIVDDIQEHLDRLSKQFYDRGIGCKACLYDALFNTPFTGVRVAFFDININPGGGGSDSQKMNSLANAIQQYIAVDNGPFALIFWTSNSQLIENFKVHVQQRYQNFPSPFLITFIDKDEFLVGAEANLEAKLEEILSSPALRVLFEFENMSINAASKAINEVYKIIPHTGDSWGNNANFLSNFNTIFSRVASKTLGFDHAKAQPDKAVYEALVPIQNHFIFRDNIGTGWSQLLTILRDASEEDDIIPPQDFNEGALNSVFHIDAAGGNKDVRGIVLEISKEQQIMSRFYAGDYSSWVKTFVPFKKQFKAAETAARNAEIITVIENSTLIAIEISSACDYSQNKSRLNKYILGFKTPTIPRELLDRPKDASMYVGHFHQNGENFQVFLNLTYVFGALSNDAVLGNPLFIFRKEIMDMIGNRYASHISRIGITSF